MLWRETKEKIRLRYNFIQAFAKVLFEQRSEGERRINKGINSKSKNL